MGIGKSTELFSLHVVGKIFSHVVLYSATRYRRGGLDCVTIAQLANAAQHCGSQLPEPAGKLRRVVKINIIDAISLAMKSYQIRQVVPSVYYKDAACPLTCMKSKIGFCESGQGLLAWTFSTV